MVVAGGYQISCSTKVPKLKITIDDYTVTNDFYVVQLGDTNAILGIQWMMSIHKYSQSFQTMEFKFKVDGQKSGI